jgi:hypothetical protein
MLLPETPNVGAAVGGEDDNHSSGDAAIAPLIPVQSGSTAAATASAHVDSTLNVYEPSPVLGSAPLPPPATGFAPGPAGNGASPSGGSALPPLAPLLPRAVSAPKPAVVDAAPRNAFAILAPETAGYSQQSFNTAGGPHSQMNAGIVIVPDSLPLMTFGAARGQAETLVVAEHAAAETPCDPVGQQAVASTLSGATETYVEGHHHSVAADNHLSEGNASDEAADEQNDDATDVVSNAAVKQPVVVAAPKQPEVAEPLAETPLAETLVVNHVPSPKKHDAGAGDAAAPAPTLDVPHGMITTTTTTPQVATSDTTPRLSDRAVPASSGISAASAVALSFAGEVTSAPTTADVPDHDDAATPTPTGRPTVQLSGAPVVSASAEGTVTPQTKTLESHAVAGGFDTPVVPTAPAAAARPAVASVVPASTARRNGRQSKEITYYKRHTMADGYWGRQWYALVVDGMELGGRLVHVRWVDGGKRESLNFRQVRPIPGSTEVYESEAAWEAAEGAAMPNGSMDAAPGSSITPPRRQVRAAVKLEDELSLGSAVTPAGPKSLKAALKALRPETDAATTPPLKPPTATPSVVVASSSARSVTAAATSAQQQQQQQQQQRTVPSSAASTTPLPPVTNPATLSPSTHKTDAADVKDRPSPVADSLKREEKEDRGGTTLSPVVPLRRASTAMGRKPSDGGMPSRMTSSTAVENTAPPTWTQLADEAARDPVVTPFTRPAILLTSEEAPSAPLPCAPPLSTAANRRRQRDDEEEEAVAAPPVPLSLTAIDAAADAAVAGTASVRRGSPQAPASESLSEGIDIAESRFAALAGVTVALVGPTLTTRTATAGASAVARITAALEARGISTASTVVEILAAASCGPLLVVVVGASAAAAAPDGDRIDAESAKHHSQGASSSWLAWESDSRVLVAMALGISVISADWLGAADSEDSANSRTAFSNCPSRFVLWPKPRPQQHGSNLSAAAPPFLQDVASALRMTPIPLAQRALCGQRIVAAAPVTSSVVRILRAAGATVLPPPSAAAAAAGRGGAGDPTTTLRADYVFVDDGGVWRLETQAAETNSAAEIVSRDWLRQRLADHVPACSAPLVVPPILGLGSLGCDDRSNNGPLSSRGGTYRGSSGTPIPRYAVAAGTLGGPAAAATALGARTATASMGSSVIPPRSTRIMTPRDPHLHQQHTAGGQLAVRSPLVTAARTNEAAARVLRFDGTTTITQMDPTSPHLQGRGDSRDSHVVAAAAMPAHSAGAEETIFAGMEIVDAVTCAVLVASTSPDDAASAVVVSIRVGDDFYHRIAGAGASSIETYQLIRVVGLLIQQHDHGDGATMDASGSIIDAARVTVLAHVYDMRPRFDLVHNHTHRLAHVALRPMMPPPAPAAGADDSASKAAQTTALTIEAMMEAGCVVAARPWELVHDVPVYVLPPTMVQNVFVLDP